MDSNKGHLIGNIVEGSIAEEMNIEPGDRLLKINGQDISDIFDFQYLVQDEQLEILILKSNGEEWLLDIEKDFDEDLGIEFENGLMDNYSLAVTNVSFVLLIRCLRACVKPCILRMMTHDFPFYKVIM